MQQKDFMSLELGWIGVVRKVLDQVEEERRAFQEMERARQKEIPRAESKAQGENETNPGIKFLTTEQLAKFLQVPKSWIYDRTFRNEIPHYKLGRHLRFDLNEIQKWLTEHKSQ